MDLTFNSLHVGRSVVASTMTSSGLVIFDSVPTIYTYSQEGIYEKYSGLKGFKSYIGRYGKAIATSNNGMYALLCDCELDRVLFFSLEKMSLLSQIKCTKTPDFCVFSSDGSYFAIANSVGRFSFYDTQSCSMQTELQFSDGISAVSFSDDLTKIAIATLDKKVHIYNISKKHLQGSFEINEIIEVLSFSKDLSSIVLFSRMGNTYVLKIVLNQKLLTDPCSEWPSVIAHEENSEIVLIGTRSNQLFIYTNSSGNNLGSITLDHWGITSISIYEKKVFVGFSDGNGIVIDLSKSILEAMKALEMKDYALLCTITVAFPFIFMSKTLCKEIEKDYIDIFRFKAVTYEEKKGYEALSAYILSASEKRPELMKSLYSSEEIIPFMEHMSSGKIDQACIVAYHTPILRQLREFNELKSSCLHELSAEIKLLEADPSKFKEHIESMPTKCSECIQDIIPDAKVLEESYSQLVSSVNAKNFAVVMDIVKKYPALRQTLVYRRLINYGEALINKTLIMIAAGKIPEAKKYAAYLVTMKPFAVTGEDFNIQINAYEVFMNACEKNDIISIFTLIAQHPTLRTTDKFKEQIVKYQNSVMASALTQAKLGEVVKMQTIIAPYKAIEYFEDKHFELLKIALISEIAIYAPLGEEQELVNSYYEHFGWNEHYEQVCQFLDCEVKKLRKLDVISDECKNMTTFILGEKHKRKVTFKGKI